MKFIIPLFFFEYRDQDDLIIVKNDIPIIEKEFVISDNFNLVIKNFDPEELDSYRFNYISKHDIIDLRTCNWAIYFECNEKEFKARHLLINILQLSFRIAKHSRVGSNIVLCETTKEDYQKYWDNWLPALRLKHYPIVEEFTSNDLKKVKEVYARMQDFQNIPVNSTNVSFRPLHAFNFLFLSYTSYYWMEVYLLLMTSIETLLSPETTDQITTRIKKRIRGLIVDSTNGTNSTICSGRKIDKLYELRSNIIHGRITENKYFDEHKKELNDLQLIVLTAFEKMLSEDYRSIYKNEESKEKFFNKFENEGK